MNKLLSISLALLSFQLGWAGLSIPHITPPDGDFETLIYFVNTSETTRQYTVTPYQVSGQAFASISLSLAGHEVRTYTPLALFGADDVSHFDFEDGGVIRAAVRYRAKNGSMLAAHVLPAREPSFSFRLQTGSQSWIWDAFALVNEGASSATLSITQYDAAGVVIDTKADLSVAAKAKFLYVLSDFFAYASDAYFEIKSDQPCQLIALEGSDGLGQTEAMFQAEPTPNSVGGSQLWIPHITPPNSDFSSQLVLENASSELQSLTLQPYNMDGQLLASVTVAVPPGESRRINPLNLNSEASHFSYRPLSSLKVRYGYSRSDGTGITALAKSEPTARGFTIFAGEHRATWDGFAIVNTETEELNVGITYYNAVGVQVGQETLDGLRANSKTLFVPETVFTLVEDGYYQITANGDMAIIALRGTRDSALLFGNPSIPHQSVDFGGQNIVNYLDRPDAILAVTATTISIPMDQPPPEAGSIIVGSIDNPFLRRVESIAMGGNQYDLTTTDVALTDVVHEGKLYAAFDTGTATPVVAKTESEIQFSNETSIHVSAAVTVNPSLRPVIEWDSSNGRTTRLRMSAIGNLEIDIDAEINGTVTGSARWEERLLERNLGTRVFFIGWLPVFVSWKLIIDAQAELMGNASGNMGWRSGANYQMEAGIERFFSEDDGGWRTIDDLVVTTTPVEQFFNVSADLTARFVLTPRLEAKIYSVAGPFISLEGYTHGNLDLLLGQYHLWVGLNAYLGFTTPLFGLDGDAEVRVFDDFREVAMGDLFQTGTLNGLVSDAFSGEPLEDVEILITNALDGADAGVELSRSDGQFEMVLSSGDNYDVTLIKTGYQDAVYRNVSIGASQTVFLETVLQIADEFTGEGSVTGLLTNALDGSGVSDLTLLFREGINTSEGPVVASTATDFQGLYQLSGLPAGHYTAEAGGEGYSSVFFTVVCLGNQTNGGQNATITPLLSGGETRIVLTWGAYPRDLDSYLTGPDEFGSRFWVYWISRIYSDNNTSANLDLDDTSSFGPETITIVKQTEGIYRYYVHDFTNRSIPTSSQLSQSGARVEVYRDNNRVASFNVPPNRSGILWHVFDLEDDRVTPVNTMTSDFNVAKAGETTPFANLPLKTQ